MDICQISRDRLVGLAFQNASGHCIPMLIWFDLDGDTMRTVTYDNDSSFEMARLSVSIGIAEHKIGTEKEELIRRVISALLKAKQTGKNRVCIFK